MSFWKPHFCMSFWKPLFRMSFLEAPSQNVLLEAPFSRCFLEAPSLRIFFWKPLLVESLSIYISFFFSLAEYTFGSHNSRYFLEDPLWSASLCFCFWKHRFFKYFRQLFLEVSPLLEYFVKHYWNHSGSTFHIHSFRGILCFAKYFSQSLYQHFSKFFFFKDFSKPLSKSFSNTFRSTSWNSVSKHFFWHFMVKIF